MNERIKELLQQVGTDVSGKWISVDNAEKLAELIIRESVDVADDYVKDCTCEEHINCKPRTSAIGRKIREHFGVERERKNKTTC
jgi:hypothetical protein